MGFDTIDKKFSKPKTAWLEGPFYWDANDRGTSYDTVAEVMEIVDDGVVTKIWEGGVTRVIYAVTMAVVGAAADASETREFATQAAAEAWATERATALHAHDERLALDRRPPPLP